MIASSMVGPEVKQSTVKKGRYTYIHDISKGLPEAIDVHHIIVQRSGAGGLIFSIYAVLFAVTFFLIILPLLQLKSVPAVCWSFPLAGFILRLRLRNQVEKESVIIFPAFGVQLETLYTSGRTARQFVPIGKILKPVLNECVTPVTCYWSLSLIIRGHEKLLLVFKELHPPVSMLVPVWKALCAADTINSEEQSNMH